MRLDSYLVEKEYFDSRTKAKQAIERGEVFIDSIKITKPSYFVYENIEVCSNENIEANASVRDNLKFQLDELSTAIYEMDVYVNHWAEILEFNYSTTYKADLTNAQCLSRYKNVLIAYNNF